MKTVTYEDFLHAQLKEDALKGEYDELDEEFTIVREVIDLRQRHNSRSITVYDVLEYLASGMSEEQILEDFPELEHEDILACLQFAA